MSYSAQHQATSPVSAEVLRPTIAGVRGRRPRPFGFGPRSGMALVIVLGLIALLIISSVTFAILMRVERAGAANARNTITARQVVKGALSYAIAAIDDAATNRYPVMYKAGYGNEVDNDPLNSLTIWHGMKPDTWDNPYWTAHTDPSRPNPSRANTDTIRDIRFWKDTLGSIDHTIGGQFASFRAESRIMVQSAENYLPYGIRHRAYAQYFGNSGSGEKVSPEWIPVATRMPKDDTDLGDVIGRQSFLAFDTTGAPDLTAIATKGDVPRRMGADPAEIQLVPGFFNGTTSKDFKKRKSNQGRRFGNVAEIISANQGGPADDGTSFAEGSSYSAYSYCPPDLAPRKSDAENDSFLGKVNVGGDGSSSHIKHLRHHKARIMKAFYDSGLTESSDGYSPENIHEEACEECGTTAYDLPQKYNSEQALWGYLGLIDYIDEDSKPEGAGDTEKFARPATENMALFNGFLATVRFYAQEGYKEESIPVPDGNGGSTEKKANVFLPTHADFAVEFDGKVVFANRAEAAIAEDAEIFADKVKGQMGFQFSGGPKTKKDTPTLMDEFFREVGDASYSDYDVDVVDGTATMRGPDDIEFGSGDSLPGAGGGANTFCLKATNRLELASTLEVPVDAETKENNRKKILFIPDLIAAGASGATYKGSDLVRLVPPDRDAFDSDFDPYIWLSSIYSPATEGRDSPDDWAKIDSPAKVYLTKAEAAADLAKPENERKGPQYEIRAWAYNVVLWGEMVDPRFLHSGALSINTQEDENVPRVAFASHRESPEGDSFEDFALAGKIASVTGFSGADDLIDLMDAGKNDDFEAFVANFRSDAQFFGDNPYFSIDGADGPGYYGQSAFQEFLLMDPHALMSYNRDNREDEESSKEYKTFHGHTDGSRLVNDHGSVVDGFDPQWHSAYSRNEAMESVGELGFLPVGPWATIRLFGTQGETNVNLKVNTKVSLFNGLPEQTYTAFTKKSSGGKVEAVHVKMQRPFHTVLDHFTLQNGPAFGRINLNTPDLNVMASVFNGSPLCSEIDSNGEFISPDTMTEGKARELAGLFRKTWFDIGKCWFDEDKKKRSPPDVQAGERAPFTRLSEMGWMFSDDDFGLADNRQREAVICNSCELFTTRGQTYTILLRGEAYSPLFGKTTVMDGDGTTLASRRAIAQIWRDTYEDDEGNHPVFVQFFKIFDE